MALLSAGLACFWHLPPLLEHVCAFQYCVQSDELQFSPLLLSFLRWYFFWSCSRGLDFSSMCSAPLFFSTVTLCLVTEIPNRWPFLAYLLELILLYG